MMARRWGTQVMEVLGRVASPPRRALLLIVWAAALLAGAEPRRIVSTAPSFTESVYALGAGDRVVAVSTYCHYPSAVEKLPRIGTYLQPNIEAITRLKPDLVLVHAEQREVVQQLNRLGVKTLPLLNTSLDDMLKSLRDIAVALGIPQEGEALERRIRGRLAMIGQQAKGKPRRSLLFVVGRTPGRLESMVAVGRGSFLNELIEAAGGRNVLADSPVVYPTISLEGVLRLNPDVIVDMGDMAETTGVSEAHKRAVVGLWNGQRSLKAVQQRRVYAVAADIFVIPGPRVAEAAEAFQSMLFGGNPQ